MTDLAQALATADALVMVAADWERLHHDLSSLPGQPLTGVPVHICPDMPVALATLARLQGAGGRPCLFGGAHEPAS